MTTNARNRWWCLGIALAAALAGGAPPAAADDAPPPADSAAVSPSPEAEPPAVSAEETGNAAPDTGLAVAPPMNPRTVVAMRQVTLTRRDVVVRSGPGDRYSIAGVFQKDVRFPVIAKSAEWYNVRLSETETGWVHSSLCKESDDLSDLEFKPNPKLFTRTGSFVLSGFGGAYAFDQKSNSFVAGGHLGYYVFDRLIVDGGAAWTHVRRPAEIVESLFGVSLEAEDFHMLFYSMNLTWEILPGRQMVPYLSGGVGASIMQGESEPSINFGGGTSLFVSKRTAVRWEVRAYRFEFGSDASRRANTNVGFTLGTTHLF